MRWKCWGLLGLMTLFHGTALAEPVTLTLSNQLVARAEYRQGERDKPAVILMHGFLQTHAFPTVSRLIESLAGEGYTVLAPNLTLGITHRSQSVACEAINHHTVADGVAELRQWVQWLKARHGARIVLGGHSLGNIYNLHYVLSQGSPQPVKLIGISIMEGSLKAGEPARAGLVSKLRARARADSRAVMEEQFSFCQKFRSTSGSLLSYMEWGPHRILDAINRASVPVTMIMGSQDDRLGRDWLDRLKKTRARVVIIQGANHFMDGEHEFDLMDRFLEELKGV